MGKFDNIKISNFDELFSKTKTVAERLNKKGAQAFDMSRKDWIIWMPRRRYPSFMKKYGRIQFNVFAGEEIDENELDMLTAQIITYREKLAELKAQLDEVNDTTDLKREAEDLKRKLLLLPRRLKRLLKTG